MLCKLGWDILHGNGFGLGSSDNFFFFCQNTALKKIKNLDILKATQCYLYSSNFSNKAAAFIDSHHNVKCFPRPSFPATTVQSLETVAYAYW